MKEIMEKCSRANAGFFSRWMTCIKDDVQMVKLVIPGAHNAGSYGMNRMAECQKDGLMQQFLYGCRQFCLRLNTNRKGELVLAHGLSKGDLFENALKEIAAILRDYPDEILLLDIREYYPQKFGPLTVTYKADPVKVDALLEAYICPSAYAYDDFTHIREVTLGDLRRSGKRYILINDNEDYAHSKNCAQILPWEKDVNGAKAARFAAETLRFFDDYHTDGLYWFQTQQTPNPGTEIGLTNPAKLDAALRPYFKSIIDGIAENPYYLEQANIIAGDFMTVDEMKCGEILRLNFLKGNVMPACEQQYTEGIRWS